MTKKLLYPFVSLLLLAYPFFSCTSKKEPAPNSQENTRVKHPEWIRDAVLYEVNLRQYTPEGNIEAFREYLPQLKELGVDILWFMPIHPISELNRKGTLGSYYAVHNYLDVNPEFGTIEDFKNLVKEAHDMGFRVILDWVANHTGGDNIWTKEHPEWYVKDKEGNFASPYNWTDTYQLDYNNQEMRQAMLEALKFWVKECDIDGYRCDVAYEVPVDFWNHARKELEAIKPVFLLAEAEHPELTTDAFDAVYNWPLKELMQMIAEGKETKEPEYVQHSGIVLKGGIVTASNIDDLIVQQDSVFPGDVIFLNHITNHDLNSWDGTEFERLGDGVKAFAVLTYTLNGMPLIYTGQEVGNKKVLEFFEKDAIDSWDKNEMFEFYRQLNELKHTQEALKAGTTGGNMQRYYTDSPNVYVFERSKGDSGVLVFLNLSNQEVILNYTHGSPNMGFENYFNKGINEYPAKLHAWEYRVYIK